MTLLSSRKIERVVVLGANGTMGYGSAALFTRAVPRVCFLARSREKAGQGLAAAIRQVRSQSLASRATVGSYDADLDAEVQQADWVFEALAEDFALKKQIFDRVEKARRGDSIVATVSSGLSISALAEGRSESFRRNFLGLHLFNPPNVIAGCELIAGRDTHPGVVDFTEAFARARLGREVVRCADTPAFAGNRVGFKVLNEAVQLAERHGPLLVDRLIGPYTGRSLPPLATIDLVGWDVHRAIVENIYQNAPDEAHETLRLPDSMARLCESGTLGDKSGGGFFKQQDGNRLVLDLATGEYAPESEIALPPLDFIDEVARLHSQGRYREGLAVFLAAQGEWAECARRVIAGYIAYALARVGEVCERLSDLDRIMATGFNWAPPGALVDWMGPGAALRLVENSGLEAPALLREAARDAQGARLFRESHINIGKFFVAG